MPMNSEASVEMSVADLAARRDAGDVEIVDVRTDEEWAQEQIEGSRHVELNKLTAAADSIDRERTVVFVCSGGNRSAMAAQAFRTSGYDAHSLAGGITAWSEQGRQLEQ